MTAIASKVTKHDIIEFSKPRPLPPLIPLKKEMPKQSSESGL